MRPDDPSGIPSCPHPLGFAIEPLRDEVPYPPGSRICLPLDSRTLFEERETARCYFRLCELSRTDYAIRAYGRWDISAPRIVDRFGNIRYIYDNRNGKRIYPEN